MKIAIYVVLFLFVLFSINCRKIFEFSPYEIRLDDKYKNTTSKNLQQLMQATQAPNDTLTTVAFISDPHYFYDELRDAVTYINSRTDVDFVVITGDLVDRGLLEEFKKLHETMENLDKPYFAVIGNHDYLADGEIIYDQMFGDRNFSFSFGGHCFIFFDDVFWESEKTPDFAWAESTLASATACNQVILSTHIPPGTDQFDEASTALFITMLDEYDVDLTVTGHQHVYSAGFLQGGIVPYIIVPRVDRRHVVLMNLTPSSVQYQPVPY